MELLISIGTLLVVIGAGLAGGGALARWRYGLGFGHWWARAFRTLIRYGIIAGCLGLMLLAFSTLYH